MHQANTSTADLPSTDDGEPRSSAIGLMSLTFIGLLLTQFLGATNDNILRWLVIGLGKQYVDRTISSTVLAVGSALPRAAVSAAGRAGRLSGRSLQQARASSSTARSPKS